MLIEFRVENHRSICEEQVITFEASTAIEEDKKIELFSTPSDNISLLPAIVLYGANASGKSNALAAIEYMQTAILHSHRLWEPDLGVPRQPFAWGEWKAKPSTFEADFFIKDVRHTYGFVVDDEKVIEEWLFAYPKGRKQTWFTRDELKFDFGDSLRGERKAIEDITRPNSLFLSAAVQNRHEQLLPIYIWFRSINFSRPSLRDGRFFHSPMNDLRRLHPSWLLGVPDDELTSQQKKLIVRFRKLLRESDFGVTDFQKIQKEDKGIGNGRTEIALLHGDNDTGAWLPLEEESSGTQTMFRLAPFVLDALQRGGLLVADELEASLHPLLAIELIRLFSSSSTNPKGAQLLFTTHDSNLLGNITGTSPLRRDQIYFAEKKPDGKSVIYPLTNFRPRKSENIERGYLQGRYGAIPYLARFGEVAE